MTTLENEHQEEIDNCSRYSLRKWEERVFGTIYEEPKIVLPITWVKNKKHSQVYHLKQMERQNKL